jgi:mRNA-degrading endonuclease YafQ of YafQ-DinJ toxin-antitoxin module
MKKEVDIMYSQNFQKQHAKLSDDVKKKAAKAVGLFSESILHPSLRLHKLSGKLEGLWSLSIDRKHRIILRPMKGNTYLFLSIGRHSIYEKM